MSLLTAPDALTLKSTHLRTALVADDHELLLAGLSLLLRNEFKFPNVLAANSFDDALARVSANRDCEIAFIDLSMPGMEGAKSLAALRGAHPALRIVVFSASEDAHDRDLAFAAGCNGYIPKSFSHDKLIGAVADILAGRKFSPPLRYLTSPARSKADASFNQLDEIFRLTARQREMLGAIGRGLSNRQISGKFGLAERTVANHITGLFALFNVRNRSELASLWRRYAAEDGVRTD